MPRHWDPTLEEPSAKRPDLGCIEASDISPLTFPRLCILQPHHKGNQVNQAMRQ